MKQNEARDFAERLRLALYVSGADYRAAYVSPRLIRLTPDAASRDRGMATITVEPQADGSYEVRAGAAAFRCRDLRSIVEAAFAYWPAERPGVTVHGARSRRPY